jgi:quercetin dioxygenase-like cupin family protein
MIYLSILEENVMNTIKLDEVEKTIPKMEGAKGVYKQVPISKANGVPTFSFRVFTIEPGGHTPLHEHPFEHLNYIIEGNGALVNEDQEKRIEKGDFALVLPGEMHQYKNLSKTQNLVLICAVPKDYE